MRKLKVRSNRQRSIREYVVISIMLLILYVGYIFIPKEVSTVIGALFLAAAGTISVVYLLEVQHRSRDLKEKPLEKAGNGLDIGQVSVVKPQYGRFQSCVFKLTQSIDQTFGRNFSADISRDFSADIKRIAAAEARRIIEIEKTTSASSDTRAEVFTSLQVGLTCVGAFMIFASESGVWVQNVIKGWF